MKWLHDHYWFLEQQVVETREALSDPTYRALPLSAPGTGGGRAFVHELACGLVREMVDATIATGQLRTLDRDAVTGHFKAAQTQRALGLAELWAIRPVLKLALLEALDRAFTDHAPASHTCEAVARSVISHLWILDELPWRDLTESLSALHAVLELDPAGIYGRMDFETRDAYRRAAERMAKGCRVEEPEIGRLAVDLARERDPDASNRTNHIGHYLVGKGVASLEARAHSSPPMTTRARRAATRWIGVLYPTAVLVVTGLIVAALAAILRPLPVWFVVVLILPASHAAVAIVNGISHAAVPPSRLPRLDFSDGIPDDCRTCVVVPTLLLSRADVAELLERLELHYLSNRDPNVKFALLTDGPDSTKRIDEHDQLADICRTGIEELNARYSDKCDGPFYLFHRARKWNARESVWMGHERKRGKLNDFNAFLLGGRDSFEVKAGDPRSIGDIRYVITLDRDTQLPLEAARDLIGTAAHPLNSPLIDPRTNTVSAGYGILQPRIGVSMASTERSLFARLQSGVVGLDPYTTAVSDVYQDLCGNGSFTGKGLYDLRAFHAVLSNRFPDNLLLSHDLIEGEHLRAGLVTNVEVIDDYPSTYEAYSKRKHRWIRGDWQLIRWLLPRVTEPDGRRVSNPLSAISRWKILDNLRRSTLELSMVTLIVAGWIEGHALGCAVAVLAFLNAGAYVELAVSAARLPARRLLLSHARTALSRFGRSQVDAVTGLVFLLHQAFVATDAIVRALARQFITGRLLLEWESMAQTDSMASRCSGPVRSYLLLTPVAALILLAGSRAAAGGPAWPSLSTALVWIGSPMIAAWLNRRPTRVLSWSPANVKFLRHVALRTWRYFVDWSHADTNWLAPDNIDGAALCVAYRTSPTNIGLQLAATLAAHDFGYLTHRELAVTFTRLLDSLDKFERHRGHFYNWYDTRTLKPLVPRYVSSVDSGNLCASLVAAKHGCLEVLGEPILSSRTWAGLRDHLACVRAALRHDACDRSLSSMEALLANPAALADLNSSQQVLRSMRRHTTDFIERLPPPEPRLFGNRSLDREEVRYWSAALRARIDESLRTVETLAPFAAAPLSNRCEPGLVADRLREIDTAARRIPTFSDIHLFYEGLETAAQDCLSLLAPNTDSACAVTRFLEQIARARAEATDLRRALETASARALELAAQTDFSFLFDPRRKLLRVGYEAEREQLDEACYGLLASEARLAVFFAIAKRDIPYQAWFHLGRTLTSFRSHRTLLSWSGTMFEYTMPLLFMKTPENTLLGASVKRAVRIQQAYGRERRVPWGVSEAAYSAYDDCQGRRYQAFGIPALAMKKMRASDLVIAPYATLLALTIDPMAALGNLLLMASKNWLGRFGYYESIDCRPRAADGVTRPVVVPVFMAHHQGMSLIALGNALFDNVMQHRFHAEAMVATAELLLQEKVPTIVPERRADLLAPRMPTAPYLQLRPRPGREMAAAGASMVLPA